MALIANNISGSASNSSRIGVTGSVLFANNPNSSFPSFPNSTVTFFVSGSSTSNGADDPSIVFKGDTFVSGAFGVSGYIQMKPVGSLVLPTNRSASYIYTSGSLNDIYFTQYSPLLNAANTTRLRWLESTLSTGLLNGGILSTEPGSTTFSITSGSALIVSPNASLTAEPYPTISLVTWSNIVSQSLTYVTSSQITYVGINPSGGLIQRITPFFNGEYLDYVSIGRVLHQSGGVTNAAVTNPTIAYGVPQQHSHFVRAFGPLKISGHVLSHSGSTLGLIKTAGDSYAEGRNYRTDPDDPNYIAAVTDTAVTTSKIYREYVSGSTYQIDTGVGGAGYTGIDPTLYNNNGTLTAVPLGQYSNQRVFWFPNSVDRAFYVYYGNETFNSLDAAQAGLATALETFAEGDNTRTSAIFVGVVIAKANVTDLSNTAQARFIQGGLFRTGVSTGGGGTAGATTPGGLDTYVQFNDGGSTFGGVAGLTFDKTNHILNVGDGSVSANIATNSATFSLVNSNATTVNFGGGASTALNIGNSAGTNTILGTSKFSQGLSGSHTKLTDGTSYLIASSPVTITTGSNGAVTIGSTASSMVGGNGSNDNVITADGNGGLVAESNLRFDGSVLNVTGSIIASNLNSLDKVLITSGSSRTISQATNLTWDSSSSYLGIAVTTPGRNLNVDTGARFGSTDYVELVAGNATSWRWATGGSITTIEHNPKFIVPTNVGNFIGFQSQNGLDPDVGFSRPAAGILRVSGSAPGAIFRFNATSTPLTAGDLGMNTTSGRPQAFIGGATVTLAHTGEIAPIGSAYVTIGGDATLTGERALTAGTGISVTDGGANSTATIAIDNSVVATISGSTFTGAISAPGVTSTAGLTQSGGNISITGQSNGSVVVGNASGTTTTSIQAGSVLGLSGSVGTAYVVGGETGTGTITLGRSTASNTINVGNATTAAGNTQTVNIATSATSTGKATVAIGNTNGATGVTISGGSTGISLSAAGPVAIGAANAAFQLTTGTGAISIGADATQKSITIGSTTGTTSVTINAGSGGISVGSNFAVTQGKIVNLGQATVSQTVSPTTSVTINSASGVISTQTFTTATNSSTSFTVSNSTVSGTSVVVVSIGDYSGTIGSNGHPYVHVDSIGSSAFNVRICNASNSNNLNGTFKLKFIVT